MGKRDVMDLQTAESIARDQVVGGTSVLGPRATAALLKEIDRHRAALAQRDATIAAQRPVIDAAIAYGNSTAEPTDTPHEDALLDALNDYAALSAPAVCQANHVGRETLTCPERESGGLQCERTDPHDTGHRVGQHSIYHHTWGNGWSCGSIDRTLAARPPSIEAGTPAAENDGGV